MVLPPGRRRRRAQSSARRRPESSTRPRRGTQSSFRAAKRLGGRRARRWSRVAADRVGARPAGRTALPDRPRRLRGGPRGLARPFSRVLRTLGDWLSSGRSGSAGAGRLRPRSPSSPSTRRPCRGHRPRARRQAEEIAGVLLRDRAVPADAVDPGLAVELLDRAEAERRHVLLAAGLAGDDESSAELRPPGRSGAARLASVRLIFGTAAAPGRRRCRPARGSRRRAAAACSTGSAPVAYRVRPVASGPAMSPRSHRRRGAALSAW